MIKFATLDHGAAFGCAIRIGSFRRAWRFRNPFKQVVTQQEWSSLEPTSEEAAAFSAAFRSMDDTFKAMDRAFEEVRKRG